jgi:MFS family permease
MPYRLRVLGYLFLLSVITYLDRVCIGVAGPRIQAELGLSPKDWGWVIGAFTIGYALFEVPGGMMADRWGARSTLTRIVLFWSIFTSATGAATTLGVLIVVRLLFGAGEAGAYPGATSAISRWFPATERSRAQSVVWMASRVGGMISPLLVVPIQQTYGWRTSFYVFGVVGVVWCIAWYFWYRDRPREKAGVTPAEIAHIEAGETGAGGHGHVNWGALMRQSNFWKLLAMYHTYCWGSFFYLGWLHTYLQKGRGFTEDEMKLWATLPFIFGAVGNLTGGQLSDWLVRKKGLKFGRRAVGATGLALGALFLFGTTLTGNKVVAAVLLSFGYFAMDCFLPVSWAVALDVGKKGAGSISGAMNMAGQLGSFLSTLAVGYLVEPLGYRYALVPLALMTAVSAAIFTRIDPTVPLVIEPDAKAAA